MCKFNVIHKALDFLKIHDTDLNACGGMILQMIYNHEEYN